MIGKKIDNEFVYYIQGNLKLRVEQIPTKGIYSMKIAAALAGIAAKYFKNYF